MFWHIDTDIISLLVMSAILLYSLKTATKHRDMPTVKFLWCLIAGVAVAAVDIAASVAMEVPVSRFTYHLLMTLDFVSLEVTIVFWFRYCLSLVYHDNEARRCRATRIVEASYIVYALFALSNPWTGLIYTLGPNNEYERGPLFFAMTLVYVIYAIAIFIIVHKERKHLPEGYSPYPLLLTPIIVGASIAAQLLTAGWLMILPGYMLSLTLAFLFLQTKRAKEEEAAEQMGMIMENVTSGICASNLHPNGELTILMANDFFYSMFGYTKAQYEKAFESPLSVVCSEDREAVKKAIRRVVDTRTSTEYEYRVVKRDGEKCIIRCQNSITSIPGLGETVLLAVMTDITALKAAEEAARVHEEEMRLAMAQLGKMICEYNLETRTLTMPKAYAEQFGMPTALTDIPGNQARSRTIEPEFLSAYQSFHEAIRRGDATGSIDFKSRWADGSVHWEHADFYSIFDSASRPIRAIIAVEDTSEQHGRFELEQSRPTLGEKNLLVHALFNLNTGKTLDYAYCDGRVVPKGADMAYFLHADNLDDIVINANERRLYRETNDRQKLLERFDNGETELSIDYRRKVSDDDIVWVRNILRMVRDPGGSDVLLFEYCYNIETEKTHELMYSALVNENFDFVGRINGKNRHYSILTSGGSTGALPPAEGDDVDEMVRMIAAKYTHPDDRADMIRNVNVENIKNRLAAEEHFKFTSRLIPNDGVVCYKTLNRYYLDREREIIILTREDVSGAMQEEMLKNEQLTAALAAAEQANLAKNRFLSRMSHELRTPMNVIIGTTELASLESIRSAHMQDACKTISSSAQYLLSIINDILEISRIESGKLVLALEPFELKRALREVRRFITPLAKDKSLVFEINVMEGVPAAYLGDRMKLQQILINLLGNAVKFTPLGGRIALTVERVAVLNDTARLRLTVADNGVGMDADFLPHLFELFAQESGGNTSTTTGTGLGLPIVKNLVELMDGSIRAESTKGKGSVFTVEIEMTVAESAVAAEPEKKELPNLSGKRILSAEDNAMNEMILENLLKKVGAEVTAARDGLEAVSAFRTSPDGYFDAILMDIRMPVMDGLTATKNIRLLNKADSRSVPIIAVSANAYDEDVELSIKSGMNAHLAKPIYPPLLFSTLEQYIFGEQQPPNTGKEGA